MQLRKILFFLPVKEINLKTVKKRNWTEITSSITQVKTQKIMNYTIPWCTISTQIIIIIHVVTVVIKNGLFWKCIISSGLLTLN